MKIYRVIDNGEVILTTDSRIKALETYYAHVQKREQIQDWGWIDTEELE